MLNIDFEQSLGAPAFVIGHIDQLLKYRSFASSFDKASKTAFCKESNNLVCTRNKIQARRFGIANLSALVLKHCKMHPYTLFQYKTKLEVEFSRIAAYFIENDGGEIS